MAEGKNVWQSKLFWLGILQSLIGILGLVADFLEVGNFSEAALVVLISGCLTVILRVWFTDQPIKEIVLKIK